MTNIVRTLLLAALFTPKLTFAEPAPTSATHDAVVIVLDDSGSMRGGMSGGDSPDKMDAAKEALKTVLRGIPPTTWIGLLAINAGWQYELGPRDEQRLLAVIAVMRADGQTPLARNIKIGADRLMQERAKQLGYGFYRLLVVTDGEETEDRPAINRYPPEVRARGLTLDVIGVAMAGDHALAKYANTYRNAADQTSLERAIREVLAERVDPSDQTGGGDAFELVAGLDPGVAQQALVALGKTENHPIGTAPPAPVVEGGGSAKTSTPKGPSAQINCGGCDSIGGPVAGVLFLLTLLALVFGIPGRKRR